MNPYRLVPHDDYLQASMHRKLNPNMEDDAIMQKQPNPSKNCPVDELGDDSNVWSHFLFFQEPHKKCIGNQENRGESLHLRRRR